MQILLYSILLKNNWIINYLNFYYFQFSSYPRCTLTADFGRLLESQQFCDMQFLVGPEEEKVMAHMALVVARSQWLRSRVHHAKENRDRQLEEVRMGAAIRCTLSECRLVYNNIYFIFFIFFYYIEQTYK